jgi:hypothetical protein
LRKIDYRLLPLLAIPYLFSYLDRGNIGNANVAGINPETTQYSPLKTLTVAIGMSVDLGLTGSQYNVCLMVRVPKCLPRRQNAI